MANSKALLMLLVALMYTSRGTADQVWVNLGHQECFNGRKNETCGYGQFCSTNSVKMGCRNCTDDDLHLIWCDKDPEEFRRTYPSCEIFCERELWRRREAELTKQISELNITVAVLRQQLNEKGEDHGSLTKVIIAVVPVAIFGLVALIITLLCLRRERIKNKFQKQQIGTAVLQIVPSCACFPRKKKPPAQAYQDQEDISAARGRLLNGNQADRLDPTAPQQPSDDGNETNNGFNSSNDNLSAAAPNAV